MKTTGRSDLKNQLSRPHDYRTLISTFKFPSSPVRFYLTMTCISENIIHAIFSLPFIHQRSLSLTHTHYLHRHGLLFSSISQSICHRFLNQYVYFTRHHQSPIFRISFTLIFCCCFYTFSNFFDLLMRAISRPVKSISPSSCGSVIKVEFSRVLNLGLILSVLYS